MPRDVADPFRLQGEELWAPLKRTGPIALYRQIADRLRLAILEGETRLPTERELTRRFAVARVTVRAALDLLADRGLVSRQRRHGTKVRADFDRAAAIRGFGGALNASGGRPRQYV